MSRFVTNYLFFRIKTHLRFTKKPSYKRLAKLYIYLILVWALSVVGCASVSQTRFHGTKPGNSQVEKYRHRIIQCAETFIGSGYRYGGYGPGFDCSGLIYRIYSELGYPIERSALNQYRQGVPKRIKRAQPGDLVFFRNMGKINHVAIVTGSRRGRLNVIHSTNAKGVVEEDVMNSVYWKNKICGIRDILSR